MFAKTLDVSDYLNGKLRLVKPSLEYASLSLKWLRDPEIGQYMGADFSNVSLETEERRIQDILSSEDTYGWMIELDGQVIGAIEINRIKKSSEEYGVKAGNFSTLIGDKQQWGKRIATFAKRAVMSWGFSDGGFELFVGKALSNNKRSWRSLERLGFEFKGTKIEDLYGRPVEWKIYVMDKVHYLDFDAVDERIVAMFEGGH